ncbi:MAG: hypothetical protein ACXAAH_10615 [Promethearchaeota archaeon]|jgi:hypothetical protein
MCIAEKIVCRAKHKYKEVLDLCIVLKIDSDVQIDENKVATSYLFKDGSLIEIVNGKFKVIK